MQFEMNNKHTTTTTPPFDSFVADVRQWTLRNFGDKQNPFIGMVEELGELSRCVIKRMQGIRGYEDPAFFATKYLDAIGDIGVYSANFAFLYNAKAFWPNIKSADWKVATHNEHIAYACKWLSNLGIGTLQHAPEAKAINLNLCRFLEEIDRLAVLEGSTLREATLKAWDEVQNRNWTQNPKDGNISK
jgi:hypothetical protein